ncbi:MAG: FIG00945424: hypothetical protein [uncultured Friedmanniella sp.]|uniref:Uncharacterized protein n=1 Tax=uncultured Friedmanniella sp. TaxID=335381 RepID=A0A6J4K4F4_9ACTN|nr:DUF6297 family protein [uncultured Friedmanniella sp.]CAA9295412.1 MAG: FIG00945424: hypothetical protein [uncultured Friedmanniella sp.]
MSTIDGEATLQPADPPLSPASPRELKRLIRDWRRGRATRKLSEVFHDAYVALIGALMLGAMLVNVVLKAQRTIAQCDSASCLSARTVLPWAGLAAAVAIALAVSRLFGPVLASAAEGFWLLDAPISRAQLLGARLVGAVAGALVLGAVLGALVAALTGSAGTEVLAWSAATGLSAAAAVAFAAAEQGVERTRLVHAIGYGFGVLAVVALTLVVAVAAGWVQLGFRNRVGAELALVVAGFAGLVLLLSYLLARVRLRQIRRARLLSGGALVSGISGAFFALDIGLARDIVVERRAVEKGHVRPERGQGLGVQALTWREWQRLRRFPQPLFVLAATVVVPYAADALGMSVLTPVLAALALFGALIPTLGGLRVLTRTGGLARCLPFSLAQIKMASITVPTILAAVWAVLTVAAYRGFGDGAVDRNLAEASLMAVATAAAGLLAAVRWTQAKGVDFSAPMVSTQAGAFPPGLMTNIFRGFDVTILVTAPMLLGFSPFWSLLIAGIAALVLLNSMDAESLRARQAEQRQELERQRKQREIDAALSKQRKR